MKQVTQPKLLFTVPEAAHLMGLSRAQVYRLLDLKQLDSIHIGRSRRIAARQLEAFIADRIGACPSIPSSIAQALNRKAVQA